METLRASVLAILDKVRTLLTTEPARLIGYGAAGVLYLVVYGLNAMGVTRFGEGLGFEAALALSVTAITFIGLVVEAIRKFVYSPMTYIEDLTDESLTSYKAGHVEAHEEEEFRAAIQAQLAAAAAPKKRAIIGTVKASGSSDANN